MGLARKGGISMSGDVFTVIIVAAFLVFFMFFLGILAGTFLTCISMKDRLGNEIQDETINGNTYLIPGLRKSREIIESFLTKFRR